MGKNTTVMKKILVTGADGGIGKAIVAGLQAHGHNAISSVHDTTDLTDPTAVQKLITQAGVFDWLVCAHGFIDTTYALQEQSIDAIRHTFNVNTLSLFWLAQAVLPLLHKGGGIIILSSSASMTPSEKYLAYAASKAAANAFVQGLAKSHSDYSFFSVAPGATNTAMREKIANDAAHMQSPSIVADLVIDLIEEKTEYQSGDVILLRDGRRSVASRVLTNPQDITMPNQ